MARKTTKKAAKKTTKKTAKKATKKPAKKVTKKPAKKTAKKAPKKAAKKPVKKTAQSAAQKAAQSKDVALRKYRRKTEERLEKLISDSLEIGEDLFGAIDSARNRYSHEWERMRRRHLSLQMAVWKVRPSRPDVEELMAGIDSEIKALEGVWKGTSKEVRKAIAVLEK